MASTYNKNHTQLSAEDLYNLKTYGVLSAQEFAPDDDDRVEGQCVCGAKDCPTEYACTTSGY